MANDSKIVITAGLQIPETVSTIKDDLSNVSKELNAKQALKVTCYIDTKNISGLQKQLSEASKNLKINLPEISTSGTSKATKNITDETVKQFNDVFSMVGKMGDMTKKEFNAQTKQMLKDFKAAWETGMTTGDTNPYYQMLDKLGQRISEFSKGDIQKLRDAIADIRRAFTDGSAVSIGESLMKELENATGSRGSAREYLDAIYGRGNYTVSKGNAGYDTLFSRDEDVVESILKAGQTIIEYQNKIKSVGWGLDEFQEIGATAQEIEEHIEDTLRKLAGLPQIDRSGEWVEIFDPEEVQEYTQEVQKAGDAIHQAFGNLAEYEEILSADGIAQTEKNIVALANGMRTIEELKSKFSSDSTVKGISADWAKDAEGNLTGFAVNIKKATGEVEKFKYEIDELNQVKLLGSTGSDRGVAKMQQDVAKLQKDLANFESSHKSIESGLIEPLKEAREAVDRFANGDGSVEEAQRALDNLKTAAANIGVSLKSTGSSFNIFDNAINKAKNFDNIIKSLSIDVSNLGDSGNKSTLTSWLSNATKSLEELNSIEKESGRGLEWAEQYKKVSSEIQNIVNLLKVAQKEDVASNRRINALETLRNRIAKTSAALSDYANKNSKAISSTRMMSDGIYTFAEKWQELVNRINSEEVANSPEAFKHLNEEIATFKKEADAAGLTVSSFFRNMRTQLSYVVTQWISLQGAIRIINSMVAEVRSLDAAMVDLKKVTDETNETYRNFLTSADKQAAELHTTTTAVVEQTAEWAKLGFNIEDAQELSKISSIYAKVGEVDNATAVSDLVTVLKAFNQTADESIQTVDALNKLGNTFATDAKSLGEGIAVSASALAMAGNDLNQSLAMLTGGTEITQNARETGNAIKVISLRIRGMKGELEKLQEETDGIESISKIQTQILNLTHNRVNIFNDDGSFKSTYEILKGVSEIYNELSDPQKASLAEILFGKVRANQGFALIQAFQSGQIEKAYETAVNSAGSAQEEFDKMSEGIEAHIQDFKEAFLTLSKTIIDSGLVNFVVDSGTTILNLLTKIIDKIGILPTLLTGLAGFGSLKGVGKLTEYAYLRFVA